MGSSYWTVAGLVANIVGTVLVGFVVPRHQDILWSGAIVPRDQTGKWGWTIGWALIVLGFSGQLIGALR